MKPIYLIPFLITLASCNNPRSGSKQIDSIAADTTVQNLSPQPKLNEQPIKDTIELKPDTTKKLLSYQTEHIFSDTSYKDHFDITLYGDDLIKSVVVFKITGQDHKELFKQTLSGTDLLDDMEDVLTTEQKRDTIRSRMKSFFDEKNFLIPAIDPKETFENAFSYASDAEKTDWSMLKADRTSVGFFYCYGYESSSVIAYLKKKKKVMEVYYSD